MGERDERATDRPLRSDRIRGFSAEAMTTDLGWSDLVLPPSTLDQLREIEEKIGAEPSMQEDQSSSKRRPAHSCLFYGPPGTGKTLAASLLGRRVNRDVYRIDLSSVVSKYIGETEKNLERIFERAENVDCILFFDEADALFGKRTDVKDAHDRFANSEVTYLLQRIEAFSGVAILASGHPTVLDDVVTRRFQSVVQFPDADSEARE